jgi:C_GCAxxG_C_C family probable redox protein
MLKGKSVLLKFLRRPEPEAENPGERAGQLYDLGMNCAQAVLQATTGNEDPALLAMAKGFGAGVGGSKCLCGAISGGVMALGLKGKEGKAGALVAAFREKNRVTCCIALTRPFKWKSKEHLANCRQLTVETAELVAKLLK